MDLALITLMSLLLLLGLAVWLDTSQYRWLSVTLSLFSIAAVGVYFQAIEQSALVWATLFVIIGVGFMAPTQIGAGRWGLLFGGFLSAMTWGVFGIYEIHQFYDDTIAQIILVNVIALAVAPIIYGSFFMNNRAFVYRLVVLQQNLIRVASVYWLYTTKAKLIDTQFYGFVEWPIVFLLALMALYGLTFTNRIDWKFASSSTYTLIILLIGSLQNMNYLPYLVFLTMAVGFGEIIQNIEMSKTPLSSIETGGFASAAMVTSVILLYQIMVSQTNVVPAVAAVSVLVIGMCDMRNAEDVWIKPTSIKEKTRLALQAIFVIISIWPAIGDLISKMEGLV